MKPLILHEAKMSGPERQHRDTLHTLKAVGEVVDYLYEPMRLILADKTTYCPDFFVVCKDHFEVHEVKAAILNRKTGRYTPFCRGDESITKLKICARMFPWWKFKLYYYHGSKYEVREINP